MAKNLSTLIENLFSVSITLIVVALKCIMLFVLIQEKWHALGKAEL